MLPRIEARASADPGYVAFEDATGKLERMAIVRPTAAPVPDPVAANALARGLLRGDGPEEATLMKEIDSFEDKTTRRESDAKADGFDDQSAPTIARRLFGSGSTPIERPPVDDEVEAPTACMPIDPPSAPRSSKPFDTAQPIVAREAKEETRLLDVSHATVPPPPPRVVIQPPRWTPPIDPSTPPPAAHPTPLAMAMAPPGPPGMALRPPIPYPQFPVPEHVPAIWPRLVLLAAGTLIIAGAVFFVLRPRLAPEATASAGVPAEATPVPMDPVELAPIPPGSPAAAAPATTTVAPALATARAETTPRKKKVRPIPARREE